MKNSSPSRSSLRAAIALLVSVVLFSAVAGVGCGDSDGDADSGSSVADGSFPGIDARPSDAAAGTPDATLGADATASDDASVAVDGSSGAELDAVCTSMCEQLDSCFGEGDVQGCISDCHMDLGDCSTAALSGVENCLTVPCQGIEQCMGSLSCVGS